MKLILSRFQNDYALRYKAYFAVMRDEVLCYAVFFFFFCFFFTQRAFGVLCIMASIHVADHKCRCCNNCLFGL